MRFLSRAALLLLVACGPTEDEFAADYSEAVCTWVLECGWSESSEQGVPVPGEDDQNDAVMDSCVSGIALLLEDVQDDSDCTYEPKQGRQCLAALEGACDERAAIYYECQRVYSGDTCESDLAESM